jgi:hypothetical protein
MPPVSNQLVDKYYNYFEFSYGQCKVLPKKDHATSHMWKGKVYWPRPQGHHSFRVQSEAAWLKVGSGLYKRGRAMGAGKSLWSLIICDHQMEQVDMPG